MRPQQCNALPSFTRVWSKENDSSQTIQRRAQPSGNDSSTTSEKQLRGRSQGHSAGLFKKGLVIIDLFISLSIYQWDGWSELYTLPMFPMCINIDTHLHLDLLIEIDMRNI